MDREKIVSQHFFKTGVLGAYETAEVDDEIEQDGKYTPCFDDSLIILDEPQIMIKRSMLIEGRRYNICSVFPTGVPHTPTDKLLLLIGSDLEKDARNG